jgi:predicted metalloprotease with PDZ domain
VYDETPSELESAKEVMGRLVDARFSVGLSLHDDGSIVDTIEGMPAAQAGIGPGMKLIAVNGRRFTAETLRDAIRATKSSAAPLELLVENTDYFQTYKLDYHGGEKYPHLERDAAREDILSRIIEPLAGAASR